MALAFASLVHANAQTTTTKSAVTTGKYKGLQISRTDLTSSLAITDSLLHFKEVPNTGGLPKLTSKGSFGAHIDITGTEDNITRAQYTISQPASGTLNKLAFTRMAFFVNVIGKPEAAAWFFQQLNSYNQAPTLPLNSFFVVDGGKIMFEYNAAKKVFSITAATN